MAKKEKDLPLFDILHFKNNLDGTVDMEIEATDELVALYKKHTGKKRATKKSLSEFVQRVIYDITQGELS